MRIQHNILAMNAYRNYTNNTNALSKNLEKLSSGYKINRAGDDAAGLAISEKMRAQITGLNAAQKNVKDGISLVKTAEGALSEVHDMLNRMTYLATQSANGTYDNETDRYQLQKEVEQLKAEINRIADSSNFNGIKLLDGSMDTTAINGVTYDALSNTKLQNMFTRGGGWRDPDAWDATNQGHVDTTKNRLESEGGNSSKAGFQISLDGLSVDLKEGESFTLEFAGTSMSFNAKRTGTYTASQLAQELAKQYEDKEIKIKDADGQERSFTVKSDGKVLTFNVHDNDADKEFKLNNQGPVTWKAGEAAGGSKAMKIDQPSDPNVAFDSTAKTLKINLAGLNVDKPGTITISMAKGKAADKYDFDIEVAESDIKDGKLIVENIAKKLADKINAHDDFKSLFKAAASGAVVLLSPLSDDVKPNITADDWKGFKVNVTEKSSSGGSTSNVSGTATITFSNGTATAKKAKFEIDLSKLTMQKEGAIKVSIGSKTYNISVTASDIKGGAAKAIAKKLADAINSNKITDTVSGAFTAVASGAKITLTAATAGSAAKAADFAKLTISVADDASKSARAGTIRAGYTEGKPVTKTDGKATLAGGSSVKWDDDPLDLSTYANKKFTVSVGGKEYSVTLVTSGSDGLTKIGLGSDAEDVDVDKLLGKIQTALQKQIDAANASIEAAAKKAGTEYSKITNLDISVGSTGKLVVTYDVTEFSLGSTDDGTKTERIASKDPVLGKELGIDFSKASVQGKTLASLAASTAKALKEALGKEITIDGDLKVDLSKTFGDDYDWDSKTIGQILSDIGKAASAAVDEWNKANADKNYSYKYVGLTTDGSNAMDIADKMTRDVGGGTDVRILVDKITKEASNKNSKYTGTINTGLQNVTDNINGDTAGLANTTINLSKVDAWQDGAQIRLGDTTYTVALGEGSKFKNVKNVIDLTDLTEADITNKTYLNKVAAQRLTVAAKDNSIFTVGHDGSGGVTLQQRTEVKDTTDMSTKDKLLSYIGVSIANADSIENAKAGQALTLQIGDTSDSYNQLKVSIGDAHTKALGIDGIDISTQEGAAEAVAKIKAAINQVSDIRGTLGATQNRLEHTANNLSVMAENIQDAESTIRDTDVAEEMMSYVKNNILIQSAQAMLAQANQIPQGVLQLLG